jgi:hypothetical protein
VAVNGASLFRVADPHAAHTDYARFAKPVGYDGGVWRSHFPAVFDYFNLECKLVLAFEVILSGRKNCSKNRPDNLFS